MKYTLTADVRTRLDGLLRRELPACSGNGDFSNSKIRRLIVAGAVFVDGRQIRRPAYDVFAGSTVTVNFEEEKFFFEKKPDDILFEVSDKDVLFEDDFLILVNKPAFFPVEETFSGAQKRDNLHNAVVRYLWSKNPSLRNPPYAGIMHRLDRDTSGVILFTKQRCVNAAVHDMFELHRFVKIYKVLCYGKNGLPHSKKFTVESFIGRISPKSAACRWGTIPQNKGGLYSKTEFSVVGEKMLSGKKCAAVQAKLFTGRTHQIRVHLSEAGFPVAGDVLYGGIPAERLMLHSERLEFDHPVTGEHISVYAPCSFF